MKTVKEMLATNKSFKGTYGIEVELEGDFIPQIPNLRGWNCVPDGSLRGGGMEYVTDKPYTMYGTVVKVRRLLKALNEHGAKINTESKRAGIHLHINVLELTRAQLVTFYCMLVMFEEGIVKYCGKSRVGNLFCLRTSDAENPIQAMASFARGRSIFDLDNENIRYSAINLCAIPKHGSIELRCMRSTLDTKYLLEWIRSINAILEYSKSLSSPTKLLEQYSRMGYGDFCKEVLGENNAVLDYMTEVDFSESMWRISDIAYSFTDADPYHFEKAKYYAIEV